MIGEIRQNFTEASASVGLILATALELSLIILSVTFFAKWTQMQDMASEWTESATDMSGTGSGWNRNKKVNHRFHCLYN